jgi:hypothetical protein
MPSQAWAIEWLNHNANRRYPLADDADGRDATSTFQLPTDFLVELDLPIHAGLNVNPARFFVRSLSLYAGGYGLVVAYQPETGEPVNVATANIPKPGFTRNSTFTIGGINDFADTVGKLVVGQLTEIDKQPPGYWEFSLESARLDPDAVRPMIRGVSSLRVVNGEQRSPRLYGDIELVAGTNMRIDTIVEVGKNPIIRLNAISGEGTVQDCDCAGETTPPAPIVSINGVRAGNDGNITIVGNDCLQIETTETGLRFKDVCSQPCCGCAELERITSDLQRFAEQATSVDVFVGRLSTAVDSMQNTVLGSKLNDRGCVQCE